jgi:adenine-specific DNA methylase
MLLCVVSTNEAAQGREYRLAVDEDYAAVARARAEIEKLLRQKSTGSLIPTETLPVMSGVFNAPLYGHNTWGSLFSLRQKLAQKTLSQLVATTKFEGDAEFQKALATCLACAVDRQADYNTSLCRWVSAGEFVGNTFGRQAIPMMWDFCEVNPFSGSTGGFEGAIAWVANVLEHLVASQLPSGHTEQASATKHPLPSDAAQAVVTDPPYYNAVPYADLSDFFYVWLKRMLGRYYPDIFRDDLAPKNDEACQMSGWDPVRYPHKDSKWYERQMGMAMQEAHRVVSPSGIGIVVFAHKSAIGWETQLQAMINAGWVITSSWPIDTEMGARLRAQNSAVLASSIHIVVRPRKAVGGAVRGPETGDWRDVLAELPRRIHEWMPRLAAEGVVGADAIFACLGPALEIFSQYSRVEKASGEVVSLGEYLEHVWAVVAKEALDMVFQGADTSGFEPDARLTAMWLWTLSAAASTTEASADNESEEEDSSGGAQKKKLAGFALEYDAARKIAQGLGADLSVLGNLVEVSGDQARLLSVAERTQHLIGKDESQLPVRSGKKPHRDQLDFFKTAAIAEESAPIGGKKNVTFGQTILDRVHQGMLLFATGRSEALRRFLVDDGIGRDMRFWRLCQALSALYPGNTDEKRWVDGILAKKKSLGF